MESSSRAHLVAAVDQAQNETLNQIVSKGLSESQMIKWRQEFNRADKVCLLTAVFSVQGSRRIGQGRLVTIEHK